MTWEEFDVWSEHSVQGFAAQQVAAGLQPGPEAVAYARRQLAELLPSGPATPLHSQWTVREPTGADDVVGWLWLRVRPGPGEVEAYVFDVEVAEHARGRGLGRATMLAGEQAARDLGADVVRLTVFAHNTAARRLYELLGYVVTSALVTKPLDGPGATDPVDGTAVPEVSLQLTERSDGRHAYAEDLHGRAMVQAAERLARAQGARTLGVTVRGNQADRAVYDRAGFGLTAQLMAKRLSSSPRAGTRHR